MQAMYRSCQRRAMEKVQLDTFEPQPKNLPANIRQYLIKVILDASRNSERSLQKEIGPSEVGEECDRRLAMTLMHETKVNDSDPWPSIVGTAGHAWLENAFTRANDLQGWVRWLTEATVPVTETLKGHVDLYDVVLATVLDFKFVGTEKMREYRQNGPSNRYRVQAHLYGKGFQRLGLPVKNVAVAFFARGGLLLPQQTGLYVWCEPFQEDIADSALQRLDQITERAIELDVENRPEQYPLISMYKSHACNYCSFFKPGKVDEGKTCPGYMVK